MRVIIIEEERFTEICELMKLKCSEHAKNSNTPERMGWSREVWEAAMDEAHRTCHYYFVKWAQSHGASCTK